MSARLTSVFVIVASDEGQRVAPWQFVESTDDRAPVVVVNVKGEEKKSAKELTV